MQTTEDLIRTVVQQVLSQMGSAVRFKRGRKWSGTFGVYPTADSAVAAAGAAFQAFRTRPLADRKRPWSVSARSVSSRPRSWPAGAGGNSDRPARPQDCQAQRRHSAGAGGGVPDRERLGDGGITLTDYSPFGVIAAITPVTHSLPTLAGNAINMLAAGNTVVFNAHPSGRIDCRRGRAPVQQGDQRRDWDRRPADHHRPAHPGVGRGVLFKHKGVRLLGGHRRARGAAGCTGEQAAGDRRGTGQSAGRR